MYTYSFTLLAIVMDIAAKIFLNLLSEISTKICPCSYLAGRLENQAPFPQHELNIKYNIFSEISEKISRKSQKSSTKSLKDFVMHAIKYITLLLTSKKSTRLITCLHFCKYK